MSPALKQVFTRSAHLSREQILQVMLTEEMGIFHKMFQVDTSNIRHLVRQELISNGYTWPRIFPGGR
jgi:hypothetical protein